MSSLALLATSVFFVTHLQRKEVTVDQLVQLGVKNSSQLRSYDALVKQAVAGQQKMKTGLAPSFSVVGSGTALDRNLSANLGPVSLTAANQFQGRLGLEADILLDISGDTRRQIDRQGVLVRAAAAQYLAAVNALSRDIRIAAFQLRQATELAESASSAKQNALDRRYVIGQLFDKGVLTRYDVLRSETEVADTMQKETSARNRIAIASANLARLLEVDVKQLPLIRPVNGPDWTKSGGETVAEAIKSRPDIQAAKLSVRAAKLGIKLADQSSRPQATFGVQSYGLSNPGAFEPQKWLSGATLTLKIPIFDRGQARAESSLARARVQEAESALRSLEMAVTFEVTEALAMYQDALDRVKVAQQAKEQAEEQYRIANQRLKAGLTQGALSPLLEVSDSQTALTQAKNNLIAARVDLDIALTKIHFVIGQFASQGASR